MVTELVGEIHILIMAKGQKRWIPHVISRICITPTNGIQLLWVNVLLVNRQPTDYLFQAVTRGYHLVRTITKRTAQQLDPRNASEHGVGPPRERPSIHNDTLDGGPGGKVPPPTKPWSGVGCRVQRSYRTLHSRIPRTRLVLCSGIWNHQTDYSRTRPPLHAKPNSKNSFALNVGSPSNQTKLPVRALVATLRFDDYRGMGSTW